MQHIEGSTPLSTVVQHPAFEGNGALLLPWYGEREDLARPFSDVGSYMPYHNHFDVPSMLDAVNALIDDASAGSRVFYPVYSADEIAADADKACAGLLFFRGEASAPFSIVCPGGGFAYAGSLHESIPPAHVISQHGYNAFSLSCRCWSGDLAAEDLAAAVAYVFDHADDLQVGTEGFALWGGSAGARMASAVGTYGTAAWGRRATPQAGTVVMAYTGQSSWTVDDSPTYSVVGDRDGIASARTMQQRIANLQHAGVPADIRVFPGVRHGFGLGIGTSAEGWMEDAIAFWEREGLGI